MASGPVRNSILLPMASRSAVVVTFFVFVWIFDAAPSESSRALCAAITTSLYLLSISFLSYSTGNDIMSTLYFLLQKVFLYPLPIDSRYTCPFSYNNRHQLFEHIFHYIVYYNIIVIFVLPNLHDSVLKPYSNNFIRIAHPFHKSLSEHLH